MRRTPPSPTTTDTPFPYRLSSYLRSKRERMISHRGDSGMNRVEGKVAIVTGGGGGIGGATAERFAREGAKVVVADIFLERAQDVVGKIGKNAHAVYLDGGDEKSVEEMVKETIARFGRVDVDRKSTRLNSSH